MRNGICGRHSAHSAFIPCVLASFLGLSLTAQEAIRMSLTGADAAEARRKARITPGYYDINLGMTWMRLESGLGLEYNNNVFYREETESDLIFKPRSRIDFLYPLTEQNSLTFQLDGGYSVYTFNPDLSRFFIRASDLSFDLYVGDLWFNVHNRLSITEDPYLDPTVVGEGDFSRLENAAGITALWDLNKVIARLGYDHLNYVTISGDESRRPDGQNEVFYSTLSYEFRDETYLGLESGLTLVSYDSETRLSFTDALQWNAGLVLQGPVTPFISTELGVGYTEFRPDLEDGSPFEDKLDGIYARGSIRHRLNQYVDYTLSGGRSISFTFYGGTSDLYFARLSARWRILQKINLTTSLDYDAGTRFDFGEEEFTRYGGAISASRQITKHITTSLSYRGYVRDSDSQNLDYTVHIVGVELTYRW